MSAESAESQPHTAYPSLPPHLSEFSHLVGEYSGQDNTKTPRISQDLIHSQDFVSSSPIKSSQQNNMGESPLPEQSLPDQSGPNQSGPSVPSSPEAQFQISRVNSYQSSTAQSALDLDTLITDKDVDRTIDCYNELVASSEKYSKALSVLNTAASEFGSSLEKCARLKGSGRASDGLMSCSGLQYLIANQQQILVKSLDVDFKRPVLHIVDEFKERHQSTDAEFKKMINNKVVQLKQNERNNIQLSRKRYRNIVSYRSNLQQLTAQLDDIDKLKHDYYLSSFEQVQSASQSILDRARDIVSLETTIYGCVANKGLVGGGLDDLLAEETKMPKSSNCSQGTVIKSQPISYRNPSDTTNNTATAGDYNNSKSTTAEADTDGSVRNSSSNTDDASVVDNDRKFMQRAISLLHSSSGGKSNPNETETQTSDNIRTVGFKDRSGSSDNESNQDQTNDQDGDSHENTTYYTPAIVKPEKASVPMEAEHVTDGIGDDSFSLPQATNSD